MDKNKDIISYDVYELDLYDLKNKVEKLNDFSCRGNSWHSQDRHELWSCPYHWVPHGLHTCFLGTDLHTLCFQHSP